MRLAETEEYGGKSQIPHRHNDLLRRASPARIICPIRIPHLRPPNKTTHRRKTEQQPKKEIQPDYRRVERNHKNGNTGNQIQHTLLIVTRTRKSRVPYPSHNESHEVAERSSHKERVYQVHSGISFKKPRYYLFGGVKKRKQCLRLGGTHGKRRHRNG